jgi:hypothetical protein
MADIEITAVIRQQLAVLREAFEGPPQRWSYFTDHGPDAGLFRTLAALNSEDASRGGEAGRRTIAAHVYHVNFAMSASAAWIRGDRTPRNWQESWRVSTVDKTAWRRLLDDLRVGYEDLCHAIESHGASTEEAAGGVIGAIAHVAFHLGAIRQKRALLRSPEGG